MSSNTIYRAFSRAFSRTFTRATYRSKRTPSRVGTTAITALALTGAMALGGCAVTNVDPVLGSQNITSLCIDHNPDAGPNYDQEVMTLLSEMGIKSRMTGGAFPGECPNRLQTGISWSDTLIPYVIALELSITGENRPLGDASYFVGQAYRTPERLGSAASKAKPLLEELLGEMKGDKKKSKTPKGE